MTVKFGTVNHIDGGFTTPWQSTGITRPQYIHSYNYGHILQSGVRCQCGRNLWETQLVVQSRPPRASRNWFARRQVTVAHCGTKDRMQGSGRGEGGGGGATCKLGQGWEGKGLLGLVWGSGTSGLVVYCCSPQLPRGTYDLENARLRCAQIALGVMRACAGAAGTVWGGAFGFQ